MSDDWNIKDTLIPGEGKYGGKAWYDEVDLGILREKLINDIRDRIHQEDNSWSRGYARACRDILSDIDRRFGVDRK